MTVSRVVFNFLLVVLSPPIQKIQREVRLQISPTRLVMFIIGDLLFIHPVSLSIYQVLFQNIQTHID